MRCRALAAVCLAFVLCATVAWAEPQGEPVAPPPPPSTLGEADAPAAPAAALVEDPGAPLPLAPTGAGLGPAPDERPRPPEPPPPGWSVPDWDLDWRSRAAGLGPPLPPADPWAIRPIRWRCSIGPQGAKLSPSAESTWTLPG